MDRRPLVRNHFVLTALIQGLMGEKDVIIQIRIVCNFKLLMLVCFINLKMTKIELDFQPKIACGRKANGVLKTFSKS